MRLEASIVIIALTITAAARAEINFNDCKTIRSLEERLTCLKQASELFQIEAESFENFDFLTPKIFRTTKKSYAIKLDLSAVEGMILESPNDFASGQYFGRVITPSLGLLWRDGSSVSLSIDYSKFIGTGISDQGDTRTGRPRLGGNYSFSHETDQRWYLLSEIFLPLANGNLYQSFGVGGDTENVWGIALGARGERALERWTVDYLIKIHYDFDKNFQETIPGGGGNGNAAIVGYFYQHALIAQLAFNITRHWEHDSFGPGLYFEYGLIKGRSITTNSPTYTDANHVEYEPRINFGGIEVKYQHDFSDRFSGQMRLWKSLINSFPDNLSVDFDNPSLSAAIGLGLAATAYF